jgi:hypothetical protein
VLANHGEPAASAKHGRTRLSAGQNNMSLLPLHTKHTKNRDRAMRGHEDAVGSFLQQWYYVVAVTSRGLGPEISGVLQSVKNCLVNIVELSLGFPGRRTGTTNGIEDVVSVYARYAE